MNTGTLEGRRAELSEKFTQLLGDFDKRYFDGRFSGFEVVVKRRLSRNCDFMSGSEDLDEYRGSLV